MIVLQIIAIPLILLTLTIAQAFIVSRLAHSQDLQPRSIFGQRSHTVGLIGILAAVIYLGLALLVVLSRDSAIPTTVLLILAITLAIILAIAIKPLSLYVQRWFNQIIFGRKQHHDEKQLIKHYSHSLSGALDIQRLSEIVLHLMVETLGIKQGIVFVNKRDATGNMILRPLSSIGVANPTDHQFEPDSPFINYFRQKRVTLVWQEMSKLAEFNDLTDDERTWLDGLKLELYVPILRQLELVGVMVLGARGIGQTYYEEDLDLLMTLADQAALAMDSARLFERLTFINQEVGTLTNQLQGLDKNKGDFLSIASHELRTPLTHILGYAKMMADLSDEELKNPKGVKAMIQGVVKGSERLKNVLDVMFEVSEVNTGKMSLSLGPVKLEKVIDQAVQPLLKMIDERRIAFGKTGLKELPILEADGMRLVQVFENLISNAIKYTPDGGEVKVEGRSIVVDKIGQVAEIVVSDNGIGIDPQYHEKVFDKFFRIDDLNHHSTGKTKFKGAGPGLGLTLVKGVVEAHGGRVWVESPGCDETKRPGSRFCLFIPLHPIVDEEEDDPKQSQIETRHWRRKDMEKALAK